MDDSFNVIELADSSLKTKDTADITSRTRSSKNSGSQSLVLSLDSSILQLVTESGLDNELFMDPEERKSHLCCGSCCDLIRAVMIVDCVDILLAILLIVISFIGLGGQYISTIDFTTFDNMEDLDDDEEIDMMKYERKESTVVIILVGCGILFSLLGILGAYKQNKYLVLLTGIWYLVDLVRSIVVGQWFFPIVTVCFAYPHFALFDALHRGKITKENYTTTEQHCCCSSGDEE